MTKLLPVKGNIPQEVHTYVNQYVTEKGAKYNFKVLREILTRGVQVQDWFLSTWPTIAQDGPLNSYVRSDFVSDGYFNKDYYVPLICFFHCSKINVPDPESYKNEDEELYSHSIKLALVTDYGSGNVAIADISYLETQMKDFEAYMITHTGLYLSDKTDYMIAKAGVHSYLS